MRMIDGSQLKPNRPVGTDFLRVERGQEIAFFSDFQRKFDDGNVFQIRQNTFSHEAIPLSLVLNY